MTSIFKTKTNRTLSVIFSFALLSAVFSSCKKSNDTPALVASVSVTNVSSVPQDVYFDNQRANSSALFYTQTIGYLNVTGDPTVYFKTSGTADVNGSASTNFIAGKFYNVFYTEDKNVLIYENDRTSPSYGKARIRFVNLSTGVGSSADFGISGGAKIVSGLTYKTISAYQEVDPTKAYSLYTGGSASVLLNIPITLTAGGIYTLYVSGTTNATVGFKLIAEN